MADVNLAEAKAHLSERVARAESGEIIPIKRRGKPVVQRTTVVRPRQPIQLHMLRAMTESLPRSSENAVQTMREAARD